MWSVILTDLFNKLRMWHLVPQGKVSVLLPLRENVTVRVSQLYEQRECRNPRFHFIDLNPVCCSCFVISFTPFNISRRHWVALFCITFWVHLGQMSRVFPDVVTLWVNTQSTRLTRICTCKLYLKRLFFKRSNLSVVVFFKYHLKCVANYNSFDSFVVMKALIEETCVH